jgi:hypothetical protein
MVTSEATPSVLTLGRFGVIGSPQFWQVMALP